MDKNKISFDNLPQAVSLLLNEVETIKSLVKNSQRPHSKEQRIPIGIDEACKLIGKAKPTVYTLVRKRILPSYKNGKKLYFFRNELLEWIENGRRKTLEEINDDSGSYFQQQKSKN
ncbi:helix-turn-helix domain-containing protein [Tenacibaculum finnmarkense]|uniref:helix-turn-helix domain-containing protein n=1 Tax=Tenacibaculum finnmarkense TaxID=2781243 RepID=UPI001E340F93|nr:helix-turn-helix domain-containing protein [Tenacibaculum finnmarkense]MCD8428635.1 helix-turn-helix domain-containing protein [Tenacibaculum finnmarkense genomovar ulcerans]MCG8722639.1 helix-turn-helix domain-containing protein [Tenacibaculum finnmarkense]